MMLIMVTSPIKSFFMHSLDLLAASKPDWQLIGCPIAFTTGKLTCQRTIQPGSRLKLVLKQRAKRWTEELLQRSRRPDRPSKATLRPARRTVLHARDLKPLVIIVRDHGAHVAPPLRAIACRSRPDAATVKLVCCRLRRQ